MRALALLGQASDHTFRFTRAYFARYAPDIDNDAYLAAQEAAGAHCDCEVGNNRCADMGC